ncbi:MAG: LmeA family phospholipid-binding protein [Actinomycetota bacterium]|nr:LmeA family phospholipid-binding protein [Actinomycetota bacterium]
MAVIILAVLLLAAEVGITYLSQRGMEKSICYQYTLPSNLEVRINSFPLLISLARNHLGELRFSWEGDLECMAAEGESVNVDYRARVDMYDVELNMTALLSGRLELKSISRIEADVFLDALELEGLLGLDTGTLRIENDGFFVYGGGEIIQYEVKASGKNGIVLNPRYISTDDEDSIGYPEAVLNAGPITLEFGAFPLEARIESARIDRGQLVLGIDIAMWDGYLQFLK